MNYDNPFLCSFFLVFFVLFRFLIFENIFKSVTGENLLNFNFSIESGDEIEIFKQYTMGGLLENFPRRKKNAQFKFMVIFFSNLYYVLIVEGESLKKSVETSLKFE